MFLVYAVFFGWITNGVDLDGYGAQVFDQELSAADALLWDCECYCEWVGYA
jgi:hypothetical protein